MKSESEQKKNSNLIIPLNIPTNCAKKGEKGQNELNERPFWVGLPDVWRRNEQ